MCICKTAFILLFERIGFILGLPCLSDRFISKISSLFKDVIDWLEKEFLDQKYLDKQDEIRIRAPKGSKDNIKKYAAAAGCSLNQYILDAVKMRMEKETSALDQ